jgi:hypothetical protein
MFVKWRRNALPSLTATINNGGGKNQKIRILDTAAATEKRELKFRKK